MPPWDKPKPWEAPAGSRTKANEALIKGPLYNATPEQSALITSNLSQEEMDMNVYVSWLNASTGTNNTKDMAVANLKYEYGDGATPGVANAANLKAARHEKDGMASSVLKAFGKRTAAAGASLPTMMSEISQFRDKAVSGFADKLGLTDEKKIAFEAVFPRTPIDLAGKAYEKAEEFAPEAFDAMREFGAKQIEGAGAIQSEFMSGVPLEESFKKGDIETIAKDVATAIAFESPNLALQIGLGLLSGGTSMGYMALSSAGAKRASIDDEDPLMKRVLNPIATGIIEVGTEKFLGTQRILDKISSKELQQGLGRRFIEAASGGALSEGGATFGENVVDKISGEDVDLSSGVLLSTIVGSIMDSSVSLAFTLGDANRTRKQNTNEEIDVIVKEADIPAEQKPLMDEMLKNPTEQSTEAFNAWEAEEITTPTETQQPEADTKPVSEEKPSQIEREAALKAGEIVGVSKEQNIAWREAQNQQELPDTEKRAQTLEMQAAKDEGLNEQADRLAESLIENPRPVEAKEVAGLLLRKGELDNEFKELNTQRNEAEEAGDVLEVARINAEIDAVLNQTDRLMQGVARAGTKQGQGLAALGMFMNKETFELVDVMNRARTLAKRPLTEQEKADIEAGVKEIERLEALIKKQEKNLEELSDEEVKIRQEKAKLRHRVFRMRQKTGWDKYTGVADFWRAMKLSLDMGYFGRQGGKALLSQPGTALPAMKQATSTLFSEKNFYTIYEKIQKDPDYQKAVASKLEILDIDGEFEAHQEAMNSTLAEKIPWVRASNRHMVTGLNVLRFGMFKKFVAKNPDLSQAEYIAYAKFVNEYTGRGGLGFLEKSSHGLTNFLLAPRWVASNWQTVVSERNAWVKGADGKKTLKPTILKEIVAEKAKFYGAWTGIAALFAAAGWDVGDDPEKSDFMKFRKGDLVVDLTAGQAQSFRLIFLAAETALATRGLNKLEHDADLTAVLKNYASYKFAPSVTVPIELVTGENIIGQERTFMETVASMVTPIIVDSAYHDLKEDANWGDVNAATALEAFGVGSQIYEDKK